MAQLRLDPYFVCETCKGNRFAWNTEQDEQGETYNRTCGEAYQLLEDLGAPKRIAKQTK